MAKDPHASAEKIFNDMLDLIEELTAIYADAAPNDDVEDADELDLSEVIEAVAEEAAERGLNEAGSVRILEAISALAKKSAEV
jgi:hypothetical protein